MPCLRVSHQMAVLESWHIDNVAKCRAYMNKLIAITLLLLSTLVFAQEKQIWACQGTKSTGFSLIAGEWLEQTIYTEDYELTVNGLNSVLRENGVDQPLECRTNLSIHSCSSFTSLLVLKSTTGIGGYSKISGVIKNGSADEPITTSMLQCAKLR